MIVKGGNVLMIMPVETDIRTKIIDAAHKLIARYGYGKTTMADLAQAKREREDLAKSQASKQVNPLARASGDRR